MRQKLQSFYRFLPVQLFFLHLRKYQLLLIFWVILFSVISNRFAVSFGAASLFLSPEYLGRTGVLSFFLLGGATAIFSMSWHITTFIIHSKRLPFLGATRHAFLKYCINNAAIPIIYLLFFGFFATKYLIENETFSVWGALLQLAGFYFGYVVILIVSFSYFFRVDRDILKSVLTTIANPSLIRNIIPYDALDRELDFVRADAYLDKLFRVKKIQNTYRYNRRLIAVVLRRHHRNAMFAVITAFVVLLTLGAFMEQPVLRIPAGAGFLLLFSVMMAVVGAFKYFLRSWEILGWLSVFGTLSLLTYLNVFDLRGIAYGLDYQKHDVPRFDYLSTKEIFTDSLYKQDKAQEIRRLENWMKKHSAPSSKMPKPPLIIISVSGGGSRSAYWTFRCLQVADSITRGGVFNNSIMVSGASGGMLGAAYWRALHLGHAEGKVENPYDSSYQNNVGKDLLNAVVFSLAAVDLISPFNKITIAGKRYSKDRGYAFDKELVANTEGLLDVQLRDYQEAERSSLSPMMVINGTIVNDGRKLLIGTQPMTYLTRAEYGLNSVHPVIDGIDFGRFFENQGALNLKYATALRMSATFPLILPVVKLPAEPAMNVMDAGLRDNYGMENALRYLHTFREWLNDNAGAVVLLQIRDTKQTEPSKNKDEKSMLSMLADPVFAIQNKWASFQTYHQTYGLDQLKEIFGERFHSIVLQYVPEEKEKSAALNFHLTTKEKEGLLRSISNADNQKSFQTLKHLLTSGLKTVDSTRGAQTATGQR